MRRPTRRQRICRSPYPYPYPYPYPCPYPYPYLYPGLASEVETLCPSAADRALAVSISHRLALGLGLG